MARLRRAKRTSYRRRRRTTRTRTVVTRTARSTVRRRGGRIVYRTSKTTRVGTRRMRGGFLPLLAPILAAAIGSIPGIVIAAKQK
ncbi:pX [Snake adenovirus 1]|uniref:Late L2 mu core protein n=2 Tax=Snake adenovirus serotype 1 TaxID=189830 RepID=L2MU_ADES1|nr:pX [Snake adenovirus 1]Q8JN69.1 RecName: Full=Late L2 mu core protein; AltName: Full=Protein X; Short=pX; AltName: Full=pMu; Flags: Precursor [Snake adenovirus 1]AAL92450.1 pX [Snake adenovirus 1]AJW67406.1 pX [Snake adenovirus 1]